MTKSNQPKQQQQEGSDMLFYSIVTALGIGLTSLCVYGYRKYREYKEDREDELYEFYMEEIVDVSTDESSTDNDMPPLEQISQEERLHMLNDMLPLEPVPLLDFPIIALDNSVIGEISRNDDNDDNDD